MHNTNTVRDVLASADMDNTASLFFVKAALSSCSLSLAVKIKTLNALNVSEECLNFACWTRKCVHGSF